MDELIKEFLQESHENLDHLDQDFVKLESSPDDRELLKSIFRTIHTIKGTCGFLGFTKLEALTHAGESLLSLLRDGEMELTGECADTLLAMVDAVRRFLQDIGSTEKEGETDPGELITRLKKLQERGRVRAKSPVAPVEAKAAPRVAVVEEPKSKPVALEEKSKPGQTAEARDPKVRESKGEEPKDVTIRVDVNLLEKQMNLVSELVLLRNRLLQLAVESNERNLNTTVHGLNYVTSELRKNVMKTRMQPVSQLFDKLPRIVRDVSKDMGKKVRLETQGGDTELDKTLLEAIKDPVTHILRNSIDHGIEKPESRTGAGKTEEGVVRVRAFHEGGNFHLEIADDGSGIDAERVKTKAIDKGLITAANAEKMTESERLNLIFLPGLSTAERVTNVSGRGVGMDVVKTNIERIGGRAKLESVRGKGTTVRLEIPLTLATIPALTVVIGNSVFAIPQAALVEMIALDSEVAEKQIASIDGVSVLRFRGTVLALVRLREELRLKEGPQANSSTINLVVVRTEGRQIALQVDAVRSTEEIVIKPLDKRFKSIALYSGATVLGDGRVALILDIAALARRAGMIATEQLRGGEAEAGSRKEKLTLLLLGGPNGERMAMPLDRVQRLEEFDVSAKEPLAGKFVMQYRGEVLPVVELASLLEERRSQKRSGDGSRESENTGKLSAVVAKGEKHKDVILEVHKILGIAKVEVDKLNPPSRAGVRGTLVVQERVTELLEMEALFARMGERPITEPELVGAGAESRHGR
jgi:two-component system chemotaxis sensor kinase CheA